MSDPRRPAPLFRPGAASPAARARRADPAGLAWAAGLAALGLVLVLDARRLPAAAGYGGVGPGFAPTAIGAALLGLALWTALDALRAAPPAAEAPAPQAWGRVLWVLAGLAAQIALLGLAGFSIATGLLFAFTARAFGMRRLWLSIPVGVALSLAVYGVFALLLRLRLPPGPIESLAFGV